MKTLSDSDGGGEVSDYRNLTRLLLRSGGLIERAEALLRRMVAANPGDAGALLRLGDVLRGKGRLDEAHKCYRRAAALRPDDPRVRWLVAVLSGSELPDAPASAAGAVPFVRQTDFLPPNRCSQLLSLALAERERFTPPMPTIKTPHGKVDAATRKGLILSHGISDREVRPWFEPLLRSAFSDALRRLQAPEPSAYRVEMAMTAFLGGGFLAIHNDNRYRRARKLSFAYYFHRQPRRFSGGDLLLHDPDRRALTRIEPQHNSIVFFPPECIHEIAAVESGASNGEARGARSKPADFGDARFGIQGWLRLCSSAEGGR